MSFNRQRFLGLTVVDFQSSVGWNEEGSSVRIRLAPEDGESISGSVGAVEQFSMGAFTFTGFVERIIERHDSGGNFYEVVLSDGKDLLRGVDCVVNSLYGSTAGGDDCAGGKGTFLNIFRFFERDSFGASGANESGITADKFFAGVAGCIAQCGGIQGYGLNIGIDTAALPEGYRIPGPTIKLLDAISMICDDLGLLWRVKITGAAFSIATVSIKQDAANNVNGTIKSRSGNNRVISWDAGQEMTNNIGGNVVIFGGAKESSELYSRTSYSDATISQFWGYDINGNPIYQPDNWKIVTYQTLVGGVSGFDTSYRIPVIGLEDIFGGSVADFTAVELAFVMGGQDSWEFWLELYGRYQQIALRAPRNWDAEKLRWITLGGAGNWPLKREFSEKDNDVGVKRLARVYAYLRNMCETYWGKQYLVEFNNLNGKMPGYNGNGAEGNKVGGLTTRGKVERRAKTQIGESEDSTYNVIPSNTGWVDPAYGKPFVIPDEIWDGVFRDQMGKAYCWLEFPINPAALTVDDSGPDCFISGGNCYIKGTVSERYVNKTHVHVSIPQVPYETFSENSPMAQTGNASFVRGFFGLIAPLAIGQSLLIKCGYYPYPVRRCLLGFKAINNDVYGPWYSNNGGKSTNIQVDSSLTPWAFGSGANLAQAFAQKLADNPTTKDSVETGSYTAAESPTISIGEQLGAGGAICSSVSANYGPNGITTTYSFRTFVPKFGTTARYVLEKMKRNAIKQSEDRRNIYKAYMDTIAKQQASFRAEMGAKTASFFLDFLGRRHDRMSPHGLLMMGIGAAAAGYGGQYSRTKCLGGSYKHDESVKDVGNLNTFIDPNARAIASLDTLFNPFRNFPSYGALPSIGTINHNNLLGQPFVNVPHPIYLRKDGISDIRQGKTPTSKTYNAFKLNSSLDTLVDRNRDYWDNHNEPDKYIKDGSDGCQTVDVNAIALRGPLMLSGWGIDLWTGLITPDATYGHTRGSVRITAPWEGAELKKTGPVDLIWDESRGVWTSHDVVRIRPVNTDIPKTSSTYNPFGRINSALVSIYANMDYDSRPQAQIEVFNLSSKKQPKGLETLAYYSVFDNRWYTKGEGCHIRFWDNLTAQAQVETLLENGADPEKIPKIYYDFNVKEGVGDSKTEIVDIDPKTGKPIRSPIHYCVDYVETAGMSQPILLSTEQYACPGSEAKRVVNKLLYFHHGLAKEVMTVEETPCPEPTTTEDPDPTTTEDPNADCHLIKYKNEQGADCYKCSQNAGAGESIVDTFSSCEDCSTVLFSYNASCTTTTSTTTTTEPPTYELCQDADTYCWYCTQNAPYGGCDGSYTNFEDCNIVAKARNEDTPGCHPTTTTLPPPTTTLPPSCYMVQDPETLCWFCTQNPENPSDVDGTYATCEECADDAAIRNEGTECTTSTTPPPTTTTLTTVPPTTPPPTTPPPGCVSVVTKVECDADGNIKTETTLVQACATQQPLVVQSNVMEVKLLRAELRAVNKKMTDIIDALIKHNIEVFK